MDSNHAQIAATPETLGHHLRDATSDEPLLGVAEEESQAPSELTQFSPAQAVGRAAAIIALLFLFLVGIQALGAGFKLLGKDILGSFFAATENPFVGLVVGVLATTLMQSSSVTTSMIVGLVAAPMSPLPLANAIPMIMGANIGTTVTNTVASLAHMRQRNEFKRAFSVATCHDFFNFMAVAVLLPLEMATGFLQKAAVGISGVIGGMGGATMSGPLKPALKAAVSPIQAFAALLFDSPTGQAVVIIALSGVLIFVSLALVVKVMRSVMRTRLQRVITKALELPAIVAMGIGAAVTVSVQSSSITTSLLVPMAGAGLITLRQAFPITLGANIGTTFTALLAALAVSGGNAEAGIQIALIHLLFNMAGTALIYPIERVRTLPLRAAKWLSNLAVDSKRWALAYVIMLFYGLPAALIFFTR